MAGVPNSHSVANVAQAMEALKPKAVVYAQRRAGVKPKNRHNRRNAGFIRQGEWFFLPRPDFEPQNPLLILRNEPISRGGGKPHMVETLYRSGGTTVYVHHKYPNGLTKMQYRHLLKQQPKAKKYQWRVMQRDPLVFAKGKIRHPDHKTIVLPFWCQVVMSGESRSENIAFLD